MYMSDLRFSNGFLLQYFNIYIYPFAQSAIPQIFIRQDGAFLRIRASDFLRGKKKEILRHAIYKTLAFPGNFTVLRVKIDQNMRQNVFLWHNYEQKSILKVSSSSRCTINTPDTKDVFLKSC